MDGIHTDGDRMTITDFLLARIAEDEAESRESQQYEDDDDVTHGTAGWWEPSRVLAECQAKRAIIERETAWNTFEPPVGVHVEWSMDAVTAVDGRYVGPDEGRRLMDEWTHPKTDTALLRILAAVYADHPDYDEAWRP